MSQTVRFAVSLDEKLLAQFDEALRDRRYETRSEAVRDLIRNHLVLETWDEKEETIGTITLVYDHHVRALTERLNDLQHQYHQLIAEIHQSQLADVSNRFPVRPGLRHGFGSGFVGHDRGRFRGQSAGTRGTLSADPVCGRYVHDGHHRRHTDVQGLQLGVHQSVAQDFLLYSRLGAFSRSRHLVT